MRVAGKTVVITGASRGIGRALAGSFAELDCRLVLTALEREELGQLAQELEAKHGIPVLWKACDLIDETDRRSLIDWITNATPDILVNNAGAGRFARFASSAWGDIERTLILNAYAPTQLIHGLLPVLRTRPEAAIVNISSATARMPYPGLAVYGACKGYLSSLSETLACELADTGIHLLCIHPGFTMTHFMDTAGMDMRRIPGWFVHSPETVAARILKILEQNRAWSYSDPATRLGTWLSSLIPHPAKTRMFRNLFWRLPHET